MAKQVAGGGLLSQLVTLGHQCPRDTSNVLVRPRDTSPVFVHKVYSMVA